MQKRRATAPAAAIRGPEIARMSGVAKQKQSRTLACSSPSSSASSHGRLQALIPQGCGKTPVRVQRSPHAAAVLAEVLKLKDILGQEDTVLVVVDPLEMLRTRVSVDVLIDAIGEQVYRVCPATGEQSVPGWSPVGSAALPKQLLLWV